MAHPTAKIISHVSSFRPEYRTDPMNSLGNWVNFQIILTHCSLAVSEIGFWSWWAPELFWCLYHVFRTMSLLIFYNFLSRQQRLGLKLNADKWVTQGINLDNFSACYMDVLQHIGYRSLCTLQWVLLQAFHTHTDTHTHTQEYVCCTDAYSCFLHLLFSIFSLSLPCYSRGSFLWGSCIAVCK